MGREVSRAANAELITAVPMGSLLPAVFQEDEFTMRWTQAMDSVLSTLITTLDCFDSYLDPTLSPPDFVEWVGSWVGVAVDPEWPEWRRCGGHNVVSSGPGGPFSFSIMIVRDIDKALR